MRGAPNAPESETVLARIIPANAGSTLGRLPFESARQDHPRECGEHTTGIIYCIYLHKDHPRECGEHFFAVSVVFLFWGSSPRMRGALNWDKADDKPDRIIPANAGSTNGKQNFDFTHEDHPRECGEHTKLFDMPFPARGSSPRMRGALIIVAVFITAGGIIPANAGSTSGSGWPR